MFFLAITIRAAPGITTDKPSINEANTNIYNTDRVRKTFRDLIPCCESNCCTNACCRHLTCATWDVVKRQRCVRRPKNILPIIDWRHLPQPLKNDKQ